MGVFPHPLNALEDLRKTLEIGEASPDPKIKLGARRITIDCYKYIMDLCTNAGIVSEAMKLVTKKEDQIDSLQILYEKIEVIEGGTNTTNTTSKSRGKKGNLFAYCCLLFILPFFFLSDL